VLQRLGLNIDSDDYPIVVFRAKKTSNLVGVTGTWVEIFDVLGEWIGGYEFTETDFTIHVFQLPPGKTVGEVRLTFANTGTIVGSMYVDFILFTKANPFYSTEDLGDVFDIPQCKLGVNDRADFLQLIIDNHNGQHKDRFAYRDEAYLWIKKNGDFQRIFGGYIDTIDPESVQYGKEYLTMNMLGWSALLYERFIAEGYEDEDVDDVVRDILDKAEKQATLGFTTFGVKDVQKKMLALKCDYDPALSKIVEMIEEYDLCFNIEPNRDASLYPLGKRFLRYAGWMEDHWEKGWACSAHSFETDGDVAQIKTKVDSGTGTLYRVTLISVDSTVFKKLLLELKGSDADTQYSVKVITEDDAEYTVQALTSAQTSYTVKEWDLTGIITGANKTVKNVKLGISKTGNQGILYFKWLGFFPTTPPYEKITLDAMTNVHAGAFQRDPKKARNMIIVKGDKFTYSVPPDSDEWTKEPAPVIIEEDNAAFWTTSPWGSGGTLGSPVISADTVEKVMGAQSTKVVVGSGTYTNWGIKHDYSSGQDWSLKHYIFMWWHGQNTGATFTLSLYSGVPYVKFQFTDNFSGWKLLIFNLDNPDIESGDFNRSDVGAIAIEGTQAGTFRIDEVVLSSTRYAWGATHCILINDQDAKAGIYSLKATFQTGVSNDFQRQSSGFILQDAFDTLDLTKYDKGAHGGGEGDTYVEAGELVNKIRQITSSYRRYIVTKDLKQLNGAVVESKLISEGLTGPTSNRLILSVIHTTDGDPTATDHVQVYSYNDFSNQKSWAVQERDHPNDPVTHYNSGVVSDHTKIAKMIITENNVKVYLDDELVCNATRILSFTEAYIYLYGSTGNTTFQYPKQDNLKIYKDIKIYVEGLSAGWKVELWSGTNASPIEKKAEATVPSGGTVAELNVLTLVFPFTGFFKVFKPDQTLDHTSPDYSDIWGGDRYLAKQTTSQIEHKVYFPRTKDLGVNAVELKKLKFWFKHSSAEITESCRLILATDDDNYYYTDFSPITKWKELFEFDVGWIQNIEFETVGSPSLKNLNYVGFLYPATSTVTWIMIDEFRFEGETEAWGIARDEESIAEIGLQPEKIFSSYYKTQEDAQKAADYWLSILKQPPLVKGSLTHPWGLPQIRAGDRAIVNVPNQNINNEEMVVQEIAHTIPVASTKFTTEINLAGVPHALTDPQKRLKEHIERLTKADVYAENVEVFVGPLKDFMSILDYVEVLWEVMVSDGMSISDLLQALIDVLASDTMSISDYLQARWIWDEFDNMNDWAVETGVWSADGVLHQTQTTTGGKWLKWAHGHLVSYIFEMKGKLIADYDGVWGNRFRRVDANNMYETECVYYAGGNKGVQYYRCVGGTWAQMAYVAKTVTYNTYYKLKTDQRNEGTGLRVKVWFESETNPCINHLEDPRSHNDGDFLMFHAVQEAGSKADFDYCYMWTE